MEKLTDLISTLTALLIAVSILILLIRLPKWLKDLGPKLSAIRRLKLGSIEAELASTSEVGGTDSSMAAAEVQSLQVQAPAPETPIEGKNAYSLLLEGKYDEGMAALKEITSGDTQVSIPRQSRGLYFVSRSKRLKRGR